MQPRSGVSNPSSVEIQDEGIILGHTRKIDFVGGGITGSVNADKVVISVPTAGGGGIGTHNIGGAEHGDATVVSPVDMEVLAYEASTSVFKNKKLHGTLLKKTDFIAGGTLALPVSSMADFNTHVGSAGAHHAYPIGSGGVASGAVPFLELRTINPVPSGYSLQAVASGGVPTFAAQVGGGGSSTFVALTDTSGSISANKGVWGNSAGAALEFGNTHMCRAYLSANQLNIVNDVATKVLLDTETFDPGNNFDPVTNYRYTAPVAGYYAIIGVVAFDSIDMVINKGYSSQIFKNGALYATYLKAPGAKVNIGVIGLDMVLLAANDYIELYAYHYAGVNTIDVIGGTYRTYLTIWYVEGN